MRALVTGGAGLIGANLSRYLLQQGHEVLVLDDLSGGRRENLPFGAEFCQCDVTDNGLVEKVFADFEPEYVYHLAAYAAEGLSHFIRRFNYHNNVVGSMTIINHAIRAKVRRLVFTSSIAVYGHGEPPVTEATPAVPADPYGVAKLAVEQDLRCAAEQFGLEYTIFRPHNVYGPFQNVADRYRNVIGIFMNQVLSGRPLSIFGDGQQTRAMTYCDDIIPILAESVFHADMRNQTFNIGSDEPVSVLEVARAVMRAMGKDSKIEHLPPRNEVTHIYADHSKLAGTELGIRHAKKTPLVVGIQRMAEWVLRTGVSAPSYFEAIELTEGLPPSWAEPVESLPDIASRPERMLFDLPAASIHSMAVK